VRSLHLFISVIRPTFPCPKLRAESVPQLVMNSGDGLFVSETDYQLHACGTSNKIIKFLYVGRKRRNGITN